MVKSVNSRHSSHLQSDSEKKELADNVGALMAVKKIDEYMNRHRLGVMNLFRDFDKSRDGLLQREEIMAGLMKLDVEMTMGQAKALVAFLDQGHDGEVDLAELDNCIKAFRKARKAGDLEHLLDDKKDERADKVFPNWLVNRRDFRLVFTRFQDKDEMDENEQIVKSLRADREKGRTHEDLQRIATWMEKREIMPGLGTRRFLELAKTVHFEEVDKSHVLCTQGEVGDAFYIIFSGSVRVIIDGGVVGELLPGNGFGERSLETDEPRSATCISTEPTQCIVIKSHEYKLMINQHQQKRLKQNIDFLQLQCHLMRFWRSAKIVRLGGCLVRRRFLAGDAITKQGEESHVMYLLYKGGVSIQKEVTYMNENRWPSTNLDYTVVTHERTVALHMRDLKIGDHFGEETALGFETRQYSAIATENTECFAINKSDVIKFFRPNQVAAELMNNVGDLYESPDEVKERHDIEVRKAELYKSIKKQAFGDKYKRRNGMNKPKKVKRVNGGASALEQTLKKLDSRSKDKEAKGINVEDDVLEEASVGTKSLADSVPSITNQALNPRRLPVLKQSMKVRKETHKERMTMMRASMSLPTLPSHSMQASDIQRARQRHKNRMQGKGSKLQDSLGTISMSESIESLNSRKSMIALRAANNKK
ncbi:hypothetical protein TrST_g9614 [Triparma strigata]|uniref:Calmodulin n=1 Tax=Triparma strigata TaxID=1606541 RepID=A0A9W6ZWE9_9STRA|nr:hypothetical protein TrST_g9614 [Triparma strigata]